MIDNKVVLLLPKRNSPFLPAKGIAGKVYFFQEKKNTFCGKILESIKINKIHENSYQDQSKEHSAEAWRKSYADLIIFNFRLLIYINFELYKYHHLSCLSRIRVAFFSTIWNPNVLLMKKIITKAANKAASKARITGLASEFTKRNQIIRSAPPTNRKYKTR